MQEQIDIDLSSEDNDPVPAEKETDKMDIDLSSDEGNGPLPVEMEAEKLDIDLSSDEDFMAKPEPANPVDDLFAKPDVDNSIVDDLFAKPMDSNPVELGEELSAPWRLVVGCISESNSDWRRQHIKSLKFHYRKADIGCRWVLIKY